MGWGVRGNWGHEYGAMIPGALAALAACLLSGREDWRRRAAHFAFFGALGWSFGGSMSYGIVLGYTRSDSTPDVFYGFAMVFLIGFLWGAVGGAGVGLPAVLDRDRLTEFYPPLLTAFTAWAAWDYLIAPIAFPQGLPESWNWYDTDWLGVLILIVAVLAYVSVKRRLSPASSLILQMAAGWWLGFLILVVVFGLRMTPPRSDNWAGCLGMVLAMLWYFHRNKLKVLVWASLATAFFAGFGFAFGQSIQASGPASGIVTNWWSIMEQTFGFTSGVGTAVVMGLLATRLPRFEPDQGGRAWTGPFAFGFVTLVITYINISKNVSKAWLPNKVIPESIYGLSPQWWFNVAYACLAAVVIALILRHQRQPLALVPATDLGRGQAFYLLFLWWILIGNLSRVLPFHPHRLVTEGTIHVNACIATLLLLFVARERDVVGESPQPDYRAWTWRTVAIGCACAVIAISLFAVLSLVFVDGPPPGARFRFVTEAVPTQ